VSGEFKSDRWRLISAAAVTLVVLPGALLALGAGASYEFATEHRLRTDYQAVAAHRAALRQTYSELLEAETGQRGFLLTGRPEYRQPYLKARAAVPTRLQRLERSTSSERRRPVAIH
jgi:CHASE3 domain sensor protein